MPIYTYVCPAGHRSDHIRPMAVVVETCACGQPSERTAANRVQINTEYRPNVRAMFARAQEAGAEMEHKEKQFEATEGRAAPVPSLWEHAKAKANAMVSAGEASDWRPRS